MQGALSETADTEQLMEMYRDRKECEDDILEMVAAP